MRSSALALLASAALTQAQWWNGAPDCAHTCLSSAWATSTAWPSPGTYCTASQGPQVASCLSSACTATPTAIASYSSLSSSLCSRWSACSSAGSTGVYTLSAPGYTGTGQPPWGGGPPHGFGGPPGGWTGTQSWTGGTYTVTGCPWNGNPWAGGPGGWGGNGGGDGPWGQWGNAWSWTTKTLPTVTATVTGSAGTVVVTGPATVAVAMSGSVFSTTTLGVVGAQVTGNSAGSGTGNAGVKGAGGGEVGVKVVGAALLGVAAVVALL